MVLVLPVEAFPEQSFCYDFQSEKRPPSLPTMFLRHIKNIILGSNKDFERWIINFLLGEFGNL